MTDIMYEFLEMEEETQRRCVGQTNLNGHTISTAMIVNVFNEQKNDYLYETIIFENDSNDIKYSQQYSTWFDAEEGHARAVEVVKNGL